VIDRPRHLIQLVLVTVKSGLRRALLTFSDADGLGEPALSPDGRFVAFDRTITVAEAGRPSEPRRHVYLLDVRAPAPKRLGAAPWNDGFPQWLSHGRSLFLLSDRSGEIDAWIQPVSNGAPAGEAQLVLRNLSRATPRGMTKDGTLYYDLAVGGVDVYTTTLDGAGAGTPSPPARIPARLSGYNISGSWSPDGSRLVFLTTVFSLTRSPLARVLTVLDTKSGEERHLAPGLAAGNALPRWSPDGRQVLVRAGNSLGQRGLFAVDVASGAERLVLSPSGDWPRPVIWSHDGHALLYVDDRGFVERDLATASERLLVPTERIGDRAVHRFGLSPDGRRIAYTTLGSPTREPVVPALWLVVPGGVPRPLFRGQRGENFVFQAWSPDGREVIVARGRPLTLAAVSVESGQVRSLGLQVPGANINLVSLNPDGRRVAFTVGSPRIELWAADGFLPAKAGDR
jgi:Tol biopolymer transport system component